MADTHRRNDRMDPCSAQLWQTCKSWNQIFFQVHNFYVKELKICDQMDFSDILVA